MSVLQGAEQLLRSRRIGVVQFEYNHRWVHSRHFLKDAFDLAVPLGYDVGKVTPTALEFYPRWHFELETFREANFVLTTEATRQWFSQIAWWNGSDQAATPI
jgi:hypothetical protein